jgi:hypothetical protein
VDLAEEVAEADEATVVGVDSSLDLECFIDALENVSATPLRVVFALYLPTSASIFPYASTRLPEDLLTD